MPELSVTIFGLGYIGLPTAAFIASKQIPVRGVDNKQHVVETINRGQVHIIEPDLEGLVRSVVDRKFLTAHTTPPESAVYIIAVPTPVTESRQPEMSSVENVVDVLIPILKPGDLVVIESTSPVGTTDRMYKRILSSRNDLVGKIHMAYCPERVLPGNVLHELEYNDRVIGGVDVASSEAAKGLYQRFVKGKIHLTNAAIAEMCKLTENAYRDLNIAFANELSVISDAAGVDVYELIALANRHPRVNILNPGVGVGGHCIAVDPWFIISQFPAHTALMRMARQTNDNKRDWVYDQIRSAAAEFESTHKRKPVIACMGLSYKPNIDDLRESPALYVTRKLTDAGEFDILAVEPHVVKIEGINLKSMTEAVSSADMIVFLVNHLAFERISIEKNKLVLDYCGLRKTT